MKPEVKEAIDELEKAASVVVLHNGAHEWANIIRDEIDMLEGQKTKAKKAVDKAALVAAGRKPDERRRDWRARLRGSSLFVVVDRSEFAELNSITESVARDGAAFRFWLRPEDVQAPLGELASWRVLTLLGGASDWPPEDELEPGDLVLEGITMRGGLGQDPEAQKMSAVFGFKKAYRIGGPAAPGVEVREVDVAVEAGVESLELGVCPECREVGAHKLTCPTLTRNEIEMTPELASAFDAVAGGELPETLDGMIAHVVAEYGARVPTAALVELAEHYKVPIVEVQRKIAAASTIPAPPEEPA